MRWTIRIFGLTAFLLLQSSSAQSWNTPTHMITGAIAHRLMQSDPNASSKIEALLRNHPWYESHWRYDLAKAPESQHGEILFMLAARWADDIRTEARLKREARWHFINWPFKPDGEPDSIKPLPHHPDNMLAALAENQRILRSNADPQKRAVALAWIFHVIGDIHQPLHTVQMFTREYPNGDRGGNEVCIRTAPGQPPLNLHQLWDGLITSSSNINRLNPIATELLGKFSRVGLRELGTDSPEGWAKESYDIATTIAYQGGGLRGTPRGQARDCRDGQAVVFLSRGYPARARLIADRRVYLASQRLADVLRRVLGS